MQRKNGKHFDMTNGFVGVDARISIADARKGFAKFTEKPRSTFIKLNLRKK